MKVELTKDDIELARTILLPFRSREVACPEGVEWVEK